MKCRYNDTYLISVTIIIVTVVTISGVGKFIRLGGEAVKQVIASSSRAQR